MKFPTTNSRERTAKAGNHGFAIKIGKRGEVEPELQKSWESNPSSRDLAWEKARRASRDAWDRIERAFPAMLTKTAGKIPH